MARIRAHSLLAIRALGAYLAVGVRPADQPQAGAAEIALRAGHDQPAKRMYDEGYQYLARKLAERTNGRVQVQVFPDPPEVIEKILTHLGLWPVPAHSPPDSIAA